MENIAYDVLQKFPPPSPNVVWGEVRYNDKSFRKQKIETMNILV